MRLLLNTWALKSAQFPVMGHLPDAEYHTPGAEILGQVAPHAERTIAIDKLLVSHVFLADIDEALNHYEVRSKYTKEMGLRLAKSFDKNVGLELIAAARGSAVVTGGKNGLILTHADLAAATPATKFAKWMEFITTAAAEFDNKDVPGTRYLAVAPDDFYFLMTQMQSNGFNLLHKDIGGAGSISAGTLGPVLKFNIVSSAHLPFVNNSSASYHAINASTTKAVAWTEDAVGTVKLMDMSLQSEWDIRRQGTLMVARYAMGHGVLRPECAIEFRTAAPV